MTRKFMVDGIADNDVVAAQESKVEVADARPLEGKDFVWLDLKILGGPDDGRLVSVSLNMPDDSASRGAKFYFEKKVRGFLPFLTNVWLMPDEQQPAALAAAITGKQVFAKLGVQAEGQYKGSQELLETDQVVDVAPAMRSVPTTETQGTVTAVDVASETTVSAAMNEPTDPPF
jgi:hypothetical protein